MAASHLEESLSAYLANELSSAEKELVEKHLDECKLCHQELDKLRRMNAILSRAGSLEPSPDFLPRLRERVSQEKRVTVFRSRKTVAILAVAAIIIFVVLLIRVQKDVQPPAPVVHHQPKIESPKPEVTPPVVPQSEEPKLISPESKLPQVENPEQEKPEPQIAETPTAEEPAAETLTAEEVEMIANLDLLENMDVIQNYDNLENMEVALVGSDAEKIQ